MKNNFRYLNAEYSKVSAERKRNENLETTYHGKPKLCIMNNK